MREELLNDKKIHYIYEIGPSIYGLDGEEEYLFIVDNGYTPVLNDLKCRCFSCNDWFKMIEECQLLPWKVACLRPKHIIKEAVKLLMTTDTVKLYDNITRRFPKEGTSNQELWEYYNDVRLTNQIIDNHKIVNFKSGASDYNKITSYNAFLSVIEPHMKELRAKGKDQSEYAVKKRIEARIKAGILKPRNAENI